MGGGGGWATRRRGALKGIWCLATEPEGSLFRIPMAAKDHLYPLLERFRAVRWR